MVPFLLRLSFQLSSMSWTKALVSGSTSDGRTTVSAVKLTSVSHGARFLLTSSGVHEDSQASFHSSSAFGGGGGEEAEEEEKGDLMDMVLRRELER